MPQPTYWHTQLADVAARRPGDRSFHVFAEGTHSDLRGQIYNLRVDAPLELWTSKWPHHLFILLVVAGEVQATLEGESLLLIPFSQLVVLPGTPCTLHARAPSAVEIVSFHSSPPRA